MAFFIPSIHFFFGLPRALFCFGILTRDVNILCLKPVTRAWILVQGVRIWGLCRWGGGAHVCSWSGLPSCY